MSEVITNLYEVEAGTQSTDYIGFSFNGVHSSELGIVRTSDGSRFNENLLPTIQDKTVQIPGGDGSHFFGSNYTQKQFNVSFAFEALTEEQIMRMKVLFGDKKPHKLIFDEMPFKYYQAKVTGQALLKYIPFEEGVTNRLYKGEGSVQFTAYNPLARSVHKYLDEYQVNNKIEWEKASGMLATQGRFDALIDNNKINLYNPGVREADFILTLKFASSGYIPKGAINIGTDNQLHFNQIKRQGDDEEIKIDTKLNLIEGYKNGKKTGRIYNQFITAGSFFKIPVTTDQVTPVQLVLSDIAPYFVKIEYDYIYF